MRTPLLLIALFSSFANADFVQPSHDCSEPTIPYEFEDAYEREQFLSDVEEYKSCMLEFVEEQRDAVRKHNSAADEAIDEWNAFIKSV